MAEIEKMRRTIRWILPDGSDMLQQAVVEIRRGQGGELLTSFARSCRMTKWLGGEIQVERDEEGVLRALWNGKVINKH